MQNCRLPTLMAVCVVLFQLGALPQRAYGQTAHDDWDVAVYPIFVWVPLGIGINVSIPPFEGDSGGAGNIVDSRFDGAFLGGAAASNGTWRIEGDGIWAGFGGDRAERPNFTVDLNIIYGHVMLGRRIAPDLYLTGGVRRLALKYDIKFVGLPELSRTPGVWDPLVGIGWHRRSPRVEWHASFEGGGFGVGADVDLAGAVRMDWKPVSHFGITGGYNVLYMKVTDTVVRRTVRIEPTLHGPIVGIGFYF